MSDEIIWGEPPSLKGGPRPGSGKTQRFVECLKERPGEWAKYPTTIAPYSSLSTYRKNFPDVEWTSRKRDDGRVDVYARWVGAA